MIFAKKTQQNIRTQAISSLPIHFFGGIHEVYFPFVLLRPILILATIAGGTVGVIIFQIFNVGAVGVVSPGSIIALYFQVHKSTTNLIGLTLGVIGSAATSLLVG